jgi:hypothetical protein
MKILSQPLNSFIKEFDLEKRNGIICFDATIYFSSTKHFVQLPTEVQVVKIGESIEVIYLLSTDIDKHFISEMYRVGNETFR